MRRTFLIVLLAMAATLLALAGGRATPAHAYASSDDCDPAHTMAYSLSSAYVMGAPVWHLGYYYDCRIGDGPRVALQRRFCDACSIENIQIWDRTDGEGLGNLNYRTLTDSQDADQCQLQYDYRMVVAFYYNGTYFKTSTPWHPGSNWSTCPG